MKLAYFYEAEYIPYFNIFNTLMWTNVAWGMTFWEHSWILSTVPNDGVKNLVRLYKNHKR